MIPNIYPVTIVQSRYGGAYEGGKWLAWNLYSDKLPGGWDEDDVTCANFWFKYKGIVGKGETPREAYYNLLSQTIPPTEDLYDKTLLKIQQIIQEVIIGDGCGVNGLWMHICASRIKDAVLKMEGEKSK